MGSEHRDMLQHDAELEECIGELLVSGHQSRRLKNKLGDKTAGYIHLGGGYYRRVNDATTSTSAFLHKGRFYTVSMRVEEISSDPRRAKGVIRRRYKSEDDKKITSKFFII